MNIGWMKTGATTTYHARLKSVNLPGNQFSSIPLPFILALSRTMITPELKNVAMKSVTCHVEVALDKVSYLALMMTRPVQYSST